jgi:NADPH:quinone reductase-like Zn-dependent oxidoreductase
VIIFCFLAASTGKKLGGVSAHADKKNMLTIKGMLEVGKIVPAIDKRYPLREAPEALRYLGAGDTRGKVIITVASDNH